MKKTLSFSLWKEPGIPLSKFDYKGPMLKRIMVDAASAFSRLLESADMEVVKKARYTDEERQLGQNWPVQADTMIGLKRLDNIQFCVESVLNENIPGDLIETGVWRGGASIFMRAILAAYGATDRRVFVADSFEGLPEPDEEKYPLDKGDDLYTYRILAVSKEEVEQNFRKYDLLDEQVVFLKGWFKDTLPVAPIEKLAVMRLDGDLYESTMDALVNLYPKLSDGGYCIVDDYALKTCKPAVDDFRREHGITSTLHEIDWTGRYWRKGE
jgi:hypothetical protein